jgi:hypothetical protein
MVRRGPVGATMTSAVAGRQEAFGSIAFIDRRPGGRAGVNAMLTVMQVADSTAGGVDAR